MRPGKIFIVSGPTGVGKTTVCSRLVATHAKTIRRIVTATTRLPRPGEIDGVDYCFLDELTFLRHIAENKFLEYANVHKKYYYGTPVSQVISNIRHGIDSLLVVDIQGMLTIKKRFAPYSTQIATIFIMPENLQTLEDRLATRATETAEERNRRMRSAENEINYSRYYDYVIVSGTKEEDFLSLEKIYNIESAKQFCPRCATRLLFRPQLSYAL